MGISLNQVVKPQADLLDQHGLISGNENSAVKRPYAEGVKPHMTIKDIGYMLSNLRHIYRLPSTLIKTVKLIKSDHQEGDKNLTVSQFEKLQTLLDSLGVEEYGFFEVTPDKVFKGHGVPHKYALVLSIPMSSDRFKGAPSIACQLEVARIYAKTGEAANQVAEFLQGMGFGASPNHSMGGQLDYSMACEWAGVGVVGRHSMAITRKSGACHRISMVYVGIDNLEDFFYHDPQELEWIKSFCEKCGKCIRTCPTHAILDTPTAQEGSTPTRIAYEQCCDGFAHYGCGICIKECPFTVSGYDKINAAFKIQKNR